MSPVYERLRDRAGLDFDPVALERKYAAERDKRIRVDAEDQFVRVSLTENSDYFVNDPYAEPLEREPRRETMEFLVVGGGWVGLVAAAKLVDAGHRDFRIIDGGGDFGGTWYWNRYPGAQCDIQSYLYLPLLEETGYVPKERYSHAPEIFEHAQRIAGHYGLYEKAIFQTWVTAMDWSDEEGHWIVRTNRGDELRSRAVILGTGSAPRPRLPGVKNIEKFRGHTFHTSRWDYGYTGGSHAGDLDKLADKRVAVIGTGATGVQCIPHVAASAAHTFVVQRTPSTVSPRGNAPTDPGWARSLEPGWQKSLMRDFERVLVGKTPESEVLKNESMLRMLGTVQSLSAMLDSDELSPEELDEVTQVADYLMLEQIRARVDDVVEDRAKAELLKPWYNLMCKRPTFNDEYLQAFNRDSVTLIDVSKTQGVEEMTETGFIAGGQHYEVDCIIYASGFEITSDFERRINIPIRGRQGELIYDHWSDGMRTMFGIMLNGFPNFYMVGGLFGFTLGLNYSSVIGDQVDHVLHVTDALRARGLSAAEPAREAEDAWIAEQTGVPLDQARLTLGGASPNCTPGYYNQEGRALDARRDPRRDAYAPGGLAYVEKLEKWRAGDGLEGLLLS